VAGALLPLLEENSAERRAALAGLARVRARLEPEDTMSAADRVAALAEELIPA